MNLRTDKKRKRCLRGFESRQESEFSGKKISKSSRDKKRPGVPRKVMYKLVRLIENCGGPR